MVTTLNFINQSSDRSRTEVVLFQKNVATDMEELNLAWKVIKNCGTNCFHPLIYDPSLSVSISDENGNHSPRQNAENGQLVAATSTVTGGRRLSLVGKSVSPTEIEVLNGLQVGA